MRSGRNTCAFTFRPFWAFLWARHQVAGEWELRDIDRNARAVASTPVTGSAIPSICSPLISCHEATEGCTVAAHDGFATRFWECRDAGEEKQTIRSRWQRNIRPSPKDAVCGVARVITGTEFNSELTAASNWSGVIAAPAAKEIMFDLELVEHLADCLIDKIHDRLWAMVERGHRRKDHASHFRDRYHVPQVTQVKRRFPRNQDQLTALLEGHVGRPGQQVVPERQGDLSQALHRARNDCHAFHLERAAGDGGRQIAWVVDDIGQAFHGCDVRLGLQSPV